MLCPGKTSLLNQQRLIVATLAEDSVRFTLKPLDSQGKRGKHSVATPLSLLRRKTQSH